MTERRGSTGAGDPEPGPHLHDELLGELLDGDLDPDARLQAEDHLAECPQCQRAYSELVDLGHQARALPQEIQPTRDLWPGIQAEVRRRRPWVTWGYGLAAAGIAALILGTVFFSPWGHEMAEMESPPEDPASTTFVAQVREVEEAYEPTIQELRLLVEDQELAPETREVLEESLAVIEEAIREAAAALEEDPGSPQALHGLRRMYDAKVEVLRLVAGRSSSI